MASDSQATEQTGQVRFEVEKLFPLTPVSVWGGSGHVEVIKGVRAALESEQAALDASPNPDVSMQTYTGRVAKRHHDAYVQPAATPPGAAAYLFPSCRR